MDEIRYFTTNNGNLTARPDAAFTYNYDGMLVSADLAGTAVQYGYDGQGNRLQATRAGTATRYVLDVAGSMSQVLMETASDGTAQAYYVYGNGVLLYKVLADNSSYFYHFDGIGSTVAMTDASENVVNHYAYSPYGLVVHITRNQPYCWYFSQKKNH